MVLTLLWAVELLLAVSSQAGQAVQQSETIDRVTEISITPLGYSRAAGTYILKQEFRIGKPIKVALLITNRSNETLVMDKGDRFFHYRPRLLKDGKEVDYLEGVKKSIDSKDKYGPNGLSPVIAVTLEPNKQTTVEYIDLVKWYGPLEAGHYELTLGHRFHHKGPHVQSNHTTFDVLP